VTVYSPLASPKATIDCLTRWGIGTRKSLGQHFLIDDGVVGRILRLADLSPDELVLEVGPGIGTLTEALLRAGARVVAIEKDERLVPVLTDLSARYPARFTLINADALDVASGTKGGTSGGTGQKGDTCPVPPEPSSFCSAPPPTSLVANLPYAVAATIVLSYFEYLLTLKSATVMVQKEVAARMAAEPGSKDYGAYTVKLRLLAQAQASFAVSRTSFLPPPRVDSTVIRLVRHAEQPSASQLALAFMVIEAAFAERRKTIRNSMRSYFATHALDPLLVDALLATAGIPPTCRGEALGVSEYQALAAAARHFGLMPESRRER
jgi:16S rRNA (adenine1518-N6/adenine1519-N6)-dimethyltransferase